MPSLKPASRVPLIRGHARKLYDVLSKADFPVRKEILIEIIWETPYRSRLDGRLHALVDRFRKKTGIAICTHRQTYRLGRNMK